jgi:UDP-2,4-diacetamido-2,4,6-trideoxy-beta-L-altropyranose hydrolase
MSPPALRVAFRADASLDIGTGHVMRCLTLADALRERGAQCLFISRAHQGNLLAQIRQRGFEVVELQTTASFQPEAQPAHAAWLGSHWQDDAQQTLQALTGQALDWLVVDHYALDVRWEQALRAHVSKLLIIDDLADRTHDCDVLLDQNLGRKAEDYATRVPAACKLLIGPAYALLRPEFALVREQSLARRQQLSLRHLLISLGGVDRDSITLKVLDALQQSSLPPNCRITVVMGEQAPGLHSVQQQATKMQWATEVQVNVRDMAALMANSDLAIGAAGTTAWERCCLGLPSIALVLADNQRTVAAALAAAGCAKVLPVRPQWPDDLLDALAHIKMPSYIQAMQQICTTVTDGLGAQRAAETMEQQA